MTRRLFCLSLSFVASALVAVAPLSAGMFGSGDAKPAKGTSSEAVSYIEGTVKTIAPHTTGTLKMDSHRILVFQYAKDALTVPYQSISNAELGPPRGKDAGAAYKIWNVHKRFGDKTRYLTVHYTDNGSKQRLVFELPERAANLTVAQIEIRQGKRQGSVQELTRSDEQWWGDQYWRTNRNADKWNKAAAADAPKGTSAPE